MCYTLKNVFQNGVSKGDVSPEDLHLGDEKKSRLQVGEIYFKLEDEVDRRFPAVLIIHAVGIDYQRNRVGLNGNFLGYLKPGQHGHTFEIDNTIRARLRKGEPKHNKITIISCDQWGECKHGKEDNVDDFQIHSIDICYKPKNNINSSKTPAS